jgi:spore germination cell wall hydrolase CwlJ-like protein
VAAPLPDPSKPFTAQDETVLLSMCIWGEARSCSFAAKLGVANVVRNRMLDGRYGGLSWTSVILHPWQFSSFSPADPNYPKLLRPTEYEPTGVWDACYFVANIMHKAQQPMDNTHGATFYFSAPLTYPPHAWGSCEHTITIGPLHFYRPCPVQIAGKQA